MEKGYMIFKVTTANGAIPLENALIELTSNQTTICNRTQKNGCSDKLGFEFPDNYRPCLRAGAKISCEGYMNSFLTDIKIYRKTTTVRIVNLDKIS